MGVREAFMAGFRAGMEKQSEQRELANGYTLSIYDSGQMQIKMFRPYVMGDKAYAVSNDGGGVWLIKIEHDGYIDTSFELVDTITSNGEDYSDVVERLIVLDDALSDNRFVDKW